MFKNIWVAVATFVGPLLLGGLLWVLIFKIFGLVNRGYTL